MVCPKRSCWPLGPRPRLESKNYPGSESILKHKCLSDSYIIYINTIHICVYIYICTYICIYIHIHRYTQTPLLEDQSSIAKRLKTLESPTREYFCRPHSLYSLPTIPLVAFFLFPADETGRIDFVSTTLWSWSGNVAEPPGPLGRSMLGRILDLELFFPK